MMTECVSVIYHLDYFNWGMRNYRGMRSYQDMRNYPDMHSNQDMRNG